MSAAPVLSFRVYTNLCEMLRTRNLKITSPIITQDKWSILVINGYVLIDASNENHHTIVALMDIASPHVANAAAFEKFMKNISRYTRDNNIKMADLDIMVITHEELGSNVTKKFDEYEAIISNYAYKYFTSNRLKHDSVPRTRILSVEERKKIMEMSRLSLRELQRIKLVDPVAVWLGAKAGDVLEEITQNEVSGLEIKYRLAWH